MPRPQPKPGGKGKPGNIGGLPWWAWLAAALIGLGIGYFLMRPGSGKAGGNSSAAPAPQRSGSGGGSAILVPTADPYELPTLEAFGLADPRGSYSSSDGEDPAPISEQLFEEGWPGTANVDRVDPIVYQTPTPDSGTTLTPAYSLPTPPVSSQTTSGSTGYVPTTVRPLDPSRAGGVQTI